MPKLQTFNAGAVRAPRSGVRADAGDFGGSVGEVLSQAGVGIGRFAAAEQLKADKAAAKAAKLEEERQKDIARDYISSSRNSLNLAAQQFAIDNPDATAEEKAKYFDSQAEQFADGAPNDIAKASIGRNIDDVRFGVLTDANKVDAVRNLDRRRDSLNTAIATNANIVQNDPSKLDIQMNEVLGHIDNSMLLTENAKRDKRLEAQQVLVNAALNARLTEDSRFYDPKSVLSELQAGKYDSILDDEKKAAFVDKAAVEDDKQSFTDAAARFFATERDPAKQLEILTDPAKARKAGFDNFRDAMFLANSVRANRNEQRRVQEQAESDIRDLESRRIFEAQQNGDLISAAKIVKDSTVMSGEQKSNWQTKINQSGDITDPKAKTAAEDAIRNGSLTDNGEIRSLPNISNVDAEKLVKKAEDRKENQGKINYLTAVMRVYDLESKDNLDSQKNRPMFQQMLQDFMEENNLTEYSTELIQEAERIKKFEGVWGFGRTSPLEKFAKQQREGGRVTSTELPNDVKEEDIVATMEANNMSRQEVLDRLNSGR